MHEHSFSRNANDIKELLKQYEDLQCGKRKTFLEEEAFELIIEYYDEKDDFPKALEVAETSLEYFPYSSILLIKKADLLIATREYMQALEILEQAQFYDVHNIDIYILKTDAFLALDMQQKAVDLLEEVLLFFQDDEKI